MTATVTVEAVAHGSDHSEHTRGVRITSLSTTSNTVSQSTGTIVSQTPAEDESLGEFPDKRFAETPLSARELVGRKLVFEVTPQGAVIRKK
jgi:hypothetical protein